VKGTNGIRAFEIDQARNSLSAQLESFWRLLGTVERTHFACPTTSVEGGDAARADARRAHVQSRIVTRGRTKRVRPLSTAVRACRCARRQAYEERPSRQPSEFSSSSQAAPRRPHDRPAPLRALCETLLACGSTGPACAGDVTLRASVPSDLMRRSRHNHARPLRPLACKDGFAPVKTHRV
jgi:hypothetical protein